MRLTYPTGNKGFTLLEVLVTVSILIFGISQIFLVFFESGSAVKHLGNRMFAGNIAENAFWETRDVMRGRDVEDGDIYENAVKRGHVEFNILVKASRISGFQRLYGLEIVTSWQEGKKHVSLSKQRLMRNF